MSVSLIVFGIIFVVPFVFIFLTAAKTRRGGGSLPVQLAEPVSTPGESSGEVLAFGDYRMFRALWNSTLLTVGSVTLIVLFSALVAFVMQRRQDRMASVVSSVMLAGLIIPPAVVPTIFLLQWLGIYKTLFGLIMVEVAFTMPFAILIFRAFMASIPSEIDEAAIMDGASPLEVFFSIILPLLKPAIITVIVTSAVGIYNDFTGPLYFLPGTENVTAQLTLVQLHQPVQLAVEPALCGCARHHRPAAHYVHVLPAPDRLRDDGRRDQGLTTCHCEPLALTSCPQGSGATSALRGAQTKRGAKQSPGNKDFPCFDEIASFQDCRCAACEIATTCKLRHSCYHWDRLTLQGTSMRNPCEGLLR